MDTARTTNWYKEQSRLARLKILQMIFLAQTSHIGSNFSIVDIMNVLYDKARIEVADWDNRDRIILSKGWAAATLYYFLSRKGLIPEADLQTYCQPSSPYIGLAEPGIKGVEAAGGSMGHGLPMGVGMAMAGKRTYVVMSDGEMNCGTTWESAAIAAHHKLDNLMVIVDVNGWQAMGRTEEVLNMQSLLEKWAAFGWAVEEIPGHDCDLIASALTWTTKAVPTVLLARTVKGKGVPLFEDKLQWHYKNIDEASYKEACDALS